MKIFVRNKIILFDFNFNSSSADAEYFARANLNSLEDVGAAIEVCKNNILETTENTSSRKSMVNRLIQLQIRQEDLKEKNQVQSVKSIHKYFQFLEKNCQYHDFRETVF